MDLLVLDGNEPEDKRKWESLVNQAPSPDVYYRPGYVRAYASTGEGYPVAVVVRNGSTEVLFPFLVRQFDADGMPVKDAITSYGYGGLLQLSGPEHPDLQVAHSLFGQLRDWALASGLVGCTIRFHPLFRQDASWSIAEMRESWAQAFLRGQTTAIQLQQWDEARRKFPGMSKGRRYDLTKARPALRLRISQGSNAEDDLNIFRALYTESMERVNADRFFFYTDEYYEHLAKELGENFAVFTAFGDGRPVASAIFLADRDFVHYHLAGNNEEGRRGGAATLLVVAAAEWAWRRGCSMLHLGGGLKANDSLWTFKSSFGGTTFLYSYVTLVGDVEQYEYLAHHPGEYWPYVHSQEASSD
jgi:hypothetical protein